MTESPERAAQWDTAAVGDRVGVSGLGGAEACRAAVRAGEYPLVCTRDRGHAGDHVATGGGVVLMRRPA